MVLKIRNFDLWMCDGMLRFPVLVLGKHENYSTLTRFGIVLSHKRVFIEAPLKRQGSGKKLLIQIQHIVWSNTVLILGNRCFGYIEELNCIAFLIFLASLDAKLELQ
ncbi:hypothetical protein ACFE04_019234 [Oxalis oulophora]